MYKIITDSSCDLPAELANNLDVEVIPLSVTINKEVYTNYLDWHEIAPKTFYDRLRNGELAQTSAPSIDSFICTMEPFLKNGYDILYLGFSSGLSNTYNSGTYNPCNYWSKWWW